MEYVHLEDVRVLKDTGKAFLIEYGEEQYWIPRACVANPGDYEEGEGGYTMSVTESIAKDKGIET